MFTTNQITAVRRHRHDKPTATWGLVPTMGALHDGHLSLIRRARAENDRVAVTIYVNPTQFAADEDLDEYPRPLQQDLALLEEEKVDLVFTPNDRIMYPDDFRTSVEVSEITQRLEGATRPTHFAGVTLIVSKLFNIMQPHRAYFGQKDAQQVAVIRQMVRDLNFNLDLVVCPIIRAADGLALSSRNQYLTPPQRDAAPVLYAALQKAATAVAAGETNAHALRQMIRDTVEAENLARLDYVSVADWHTLEECSHIGPDTLISLAVYFHKTRLIDNIVVSPAVDDDA